MIIGIEATHANKNNRTGVEEYCFEMINRLKKIIPAEVRVDLYSNTLLIDGLKDLPINWRLKILSWPLTKGWSQIRLSWYFLFNKPDIFFAPGQLIPLISPKNTVTTIHDSAFKVYPKVYRFLGRQYLKLMNLLILQKSKIIITPSEFSKNELNRLYGYDLKKVVSIPLGFNHNVYNKKEIDDAIKNSLMEKYNLDKPYIIFVGRLEEKKNLVNMIKAFNLVREKINISFVLVGMPGCGFNQIEKQINESPCKSDIKVCGWVPKEDLPLLYNQAEALFYVSRYEGFGLPLLQAMACGCPAIISNGNSLEEVGGDAVLLAKADSIFEMADQLFCLLTDTFLRNQLISRGLDKAKDFYWDKTAQNIWQTLQKAID